MSFAARRMIFSAITLVSVLGLSWFFSSRQEAERSAPAPPMAASPAPAPTSTPEAEGGYVQPDIADLPPGIVGSAIREEPAGDRIPLCDDRNWEFIDGLVSGVEDGVLIVNDEAWKRAGASARAGVSGWASKCKLAGAAVVIVGEESGQELGGYDPASGYLSADQAVP